MSQLIKFTGDIWPPERRGPGIYDFTIKVPANKWWAIVHTNNADGTRLNLRFRDENLPHFYFDILSASLMADVKRNLCRFLIPLARQIRAHKCDVYPVNPFDVVLDLKDLIPPSPYPGPLATRIFQTCYLDQLLPGLPDVKLFDKIVPNTTALTSTQYYTWIEKLIKAKLTAHSYKMSIVEPMPLNLESLLETLQARGSLTQLYIGCEVLSDPAHASLLKVLDKALLTEYPLPATTNYPEIHQAFIKSRTRFADLWSIGVASCWP